jgi:hypothetical protein
MDLGILKITLSSIKKKKKNLKTLKENHRKKKKYIYYRCVFDIFIEGLRYKKLQG